MTAAIEVSGLVKSFGHTRALDGLDLTVETGEVHGFLAHAWRRGDRSYRAVAGHSRSSRRDAGF
jgi:polyether ionophore transport system ATP-binding protein